MQSRLQSLIEVSVNIAIGFLVALLAQLVIFPMFGIHVEFYKDVMIAGCFTVVSMIRMYVLRRFFNQRLRNWLEKIDQGEN